MMKYASLLLLPLLLLSISCRSIMIHPKFNPNEVLDKSYSLMDCDEENRTEYVKIDNGKSYKNVYNRNGLLISQYELNDTNNKHIVGVFKEWHGNGKLKCDGFNNNKSHLDGEFKSFFENGKIRRIENYNNGKRISGKCFDTLGNEVKFFEYLID